MTQPSLTPLLVAGIAAAGLMLIVFPQSLNDIAAYFPRAFAAATPEQALRLASVLRFRTAAEAKSPRFSRFTGAFALLTAVAIVFLHVPASLGYAALVLCLALQMAVAYGEFQASSERRAARLTRRTWYRVLSPAVLVYAAASLYGIIACAAVPQLRPTATLLFPAVAIMLTLAARIAVAPARLLGHDPEIEDLVDDRIRFYRANAIAVAAGLPINVFITFSQDYLPHTVEYAFLPSIVGFACAAAMWIALVLPARRPLALP